MFQPLLFIQRTSMGLMLFRRKKESQNGLKKKKYKE